MIFCRTFFVSQCRKILEEFFSVSFSFGYGKLSCIGSVCHDFLSNVFYLGVPKNFVGEPFCVKEVLCIEKIYG